MKQFVIASLFASTLSLGFVVNTASAEYGYEPIPEYIYQSSFADEAAQRKNRTLFDIANHKGYDRNAKEIYKGIGVSFFPVAQGMQIEQVMKKTSAALVWLKSNDIITSVDGVSLAGASSSDFLNAIRYNDAKRVFVITVIKASTGKVVTLKIKKSEVHHYYNRITLATLAGISNYIGSRAQNMKIKAYLLAH